MNIVLTLKKTSEVDGQMFADRISRDYSVLHVNIHESDK